MIKQTTNSFLMAKKTELLDRDCSLPMDEKKGTCVCVYIRVQFGPRTSVICYENKL